MINLQAITPHFSTTYEVGAILKDSWGCEQTNIDFFCIIARKGDWLTILPMKKTSSPDGNQFSMTTKESPLSIDLTAKPQRKKLKIWNGEERGFSFRDYTGGGWCSLWSGKAATATHYA